MATLAIPHAFSKTNDVVTLSIGTASFDTVFKPMIRQRLQEFFLISGERFFPLP